MLFSSNIFLFLFLPLVLGLYFLAHERAKNYILLAASLIFYAWGGVAAAGMMIVNIAINYAGAIAVDKWRERKLPLILTLTANFGMLFYFKYMNFFMAQIGMAGFAKIALPIGISFFIFQGVSYLIDVYRREVPPQKNPLKLALFISCFPQLIAGPIVKYHDIDEQLDVRSTTAADFLYGIRRFIMGLGKKVLLANTFAVIADEIFKLPVAEISVAQAWLGALAYSMQIFFDFSGYSDMAIGLMRVFGFRIPENFNYPYIAKSITDFWRRWHISLSTWFKEYLYIPLGGNRTGHTYRNLWLVFLATGIWHGAEWTFVLWGLWHGLFIVMEKKIDVDKFRGAWAHFYTLAVVLVGWVLFRTENITKAWQYLKRMFGLINGTAIFQWPWFCDNIQYITFAAAVLLCTPIFGKWIHTRREWMLNAWLIVVFLLSATMIVAGGYNPFIYFRF